MIIALLMAMGLLAGLSGVMGNEEGGSAEGSDAAEALKGSDQDDTIMAGGGSDLIVGFDGNDLLDGQDGNDWIFGLDGNDQIDGGTGNDVISGGAGADTLTGGAGNDFMESAGIVNEETLLASVKSAKNFGDIAFVYDFDRAPEDGDLVDMGAGDDSIVAGGGDTVTGGSGADEFALGDWGSGQPPVVITDYTPGEDVITFAHDAARPDPVFESYVNPVSGDAELHADGELFLIVRGAGPDFSPAQIVQRSY